MWEYDSRKPLYRLTGVEGTVKALKFSEDDRFLAAIGEGNSNGNDIAIWDMQNGSVAQYLKSPRNCATCMCWGRTVVADPSRRVKTPKYSLFTFHSVQVCPRPRPSLSECSFHNLHQHPAALESIHEYSCHTSCHGRILSYSHASPRSQPSATPRGAQAARRAHRRRRRRCRCTSSSTTSGP